MTKQLQDGLCVRVDTEKTQYLVGENIVGTVILVATTPIEHGGIHLRLGCVAYVRWATSNGKTTAIHSKRKDLANHQSTVFPEGVLPSGEYALPFQWAAPVDAPASFNLNFRGDKEAYVKHRIKVRVSSTSFLSRDSRYEHVFQVYQPSIPVSAYVQMDHPVSNYCCIPSGNVFMSLSLPTNTVFPGETITAAVKMDASQCRSKSATAIFQLKQKLKLDAHGTVFRQSKVVSQWSGNILAAGEIYEKIKILAVPNDLQCSLNTREIHCQYFLTINLDYGLLQKKKLSAEVIVGVPLQVNTTKWYELPPKNDAEPPPYDEDSDWSETA
jgi:hypothetical protein